MRTPILLTLLAFSAITPRRGDARQVAVGDSIGVRPTKTVLPERSPSSKWVERPWTTATVIRVTPDTLWYRTDDGLAQMAVTDAEIRRPTGRGHRGRGAVLGALSGAAIVGLVANLSFEPEYQLGSIGDAFVCAMNNCEVPQSNSRSGETWAGAVLGASLGGIIGYQIGKRAGRWESVDLVPSVKSEGVVSMNLRVTF